MHANRDQTRCSGDMSTGTEAQCIGEGARHAFYNAMDKF